MSPVTGAESGHLDSECLPGAIAGNVGHRDLAAGMERGGDNSHGSFEAMFARLDAAQARQRDDDSDSAVTAHAKIADVVEEEDARGAGRVCRLAEKGSDHYVRPPRLVDDGRAEPVIFPLEAVSPLRQRPRPEVWAARHDDSRWFAAGVRVDHGDAI